MLVNIALKPAANVSVNIPYLIAKREDRDKPLSVDRYSAVSPSLVIRVKPSTPEGQHCYHDCKSVAESSQIQVVCSSMAAVPLETFETRSLTYKYAWP